MVDGDRRDHRGERALDHIGGVEAAAEADFQQQHVGGMARKQQQPGRGGDLEHGDRLAGIGAFALLQRGAKLRVGDKLAFIVRTAGSPAFGIIEWPKSGSPDVDSAARRKRSLKRTRCGEV